jgi:uncharacterized membrane protein
MAETGVPMETDSRRERTESARLDNFVDGAFAFAITLLVISGAGLPRDVDALERALRGVPAFAACFAQLVFFWHGHVRWRDAVRLADRTSLYLSLLLVFFALIFVFPLHLVFAGLANGLSDGALSPDVSSFTGSSRGIAALFICYGTSFACMAGTLALLYRHAARTAVAEHHSDAISLRVDVVVWGYYAAVGVLSTLLALTLPARAGWFTGLPGFSFFLLSFTGPVVTRYRAYLTRKATP